MRSKVSAFALVLSLVLSGCAIETLTGPEDGSGTPSGSESPEPRATLALPEAVSAPPDSGLADTIENVLPSVVNIRVESLSFDPLSGSRTVRGQGSGVVIDGSGLILTNAHVIQDASRVTVVFNDGHGRMEGEVLGVAPEKDIAVVEVDADDLSPLRIGRSSALRLGHEVVAIGFPLGLGGASVTKGIVSALDRNIEVSEGVQRSLEGLIQTDAAINPGNSGGPLIDLNGRLVGINTAAAQAGAAENVGFAIPVDSAFPIAQEIISEPPEERAWLGVQIRSIESSAAAAQVDLDPDARGALIVGLFPDGAAIEAGAEEGDLIVEVGDIEVRSAEDLTQALTEFDPGDRVDMVVLRPDGTSTLEVVLSQRPATFPVP